MRKNTEATLTVMNLKGHPIESVEIRLQMPLRYAALLVCSDKACAALRKDLGKFLESKWGTLRPVRQLLARKGRNR